jgi:hypothetical protein
MMMADVQIRILAEVAKANSQLKSLDDRMKGMNATSATLSTGFSTVGIALAGIASAGYTARKMWDATAGSVIAYNKTILDSAMATGNTTEEFSRIVQVADDFGIGIDEVTRALEMMTKNGITPSISNLADLFDEVNAIEDPSKRAATLARLLGRNWAVIDPVIQRGGAAFRSATAAIEDGLVATDEEVQKTEEMRLELDRLTDSWTSYKNTVGLAVVGAINDEIEAGDRQSDSIDYRQRAYQDLVARGIQPTRASVAGLAAEMKRADTAAAESARNIELLATAGRNLPGEFHGMIRDFHVAAAVDLTIANPESFREAVLGIVTQRAETTATAGSEAAADWIAGWMAENPGKTVADAFQAYLDDFNASLASTQDNLSVGILGGLLDAGIEAAAIPVKAGDVSAWAAAKKLANTFSVELANAGDNAWDIVRAIQAINDAGGVPNIGGDGGGDGERPGGESEFQHGADFVVPPGFPNDSFPMRVSSGERVVVIPQNTQNNSRSFTFNTTVNDSAGGMGLLERMKQDVRRL